MTQYQKNNVAEKNNIFLFFSRQRCNRIVSDVKYQLLGCHMAHNRFQD